PGCREKTHTACACERAAQPFGGSEPLFRSSLLLQCETFSTSHTLNEMVSQNDWKRNETMTAVDEAYWHSYYDVHNQARFVELVDTFYDTNASFANPRKQFHDARS
ncbi:MAG: hypothetical protein AAGC86_13885, partial [Pseudomonadota bacterium]